MKHLYFFCYAFVLTQLFKNALYNKQVRKLAPFDTIVHLLTLAKQVTLTHFLPLLANLSLLGPLLYDSLYAVWFIDNTSSANFMIFPQYKNTIQILEQIDSLLKKKSTSLMLRGVFHRETLLSFHLLIPNKITSSVPTTLDQALVIFSCSTLPLI